MTLQIQLGGNTVPIQVQSSGLGAALALNRSSAADAASADAAASTAVSAAGIATAAAAEAAGATATKLGLTMDNLSSLIGEVSVDPTYAGTGAATSGSPRIFYGTNVPSGDDSAVCVGRAIDGALLFSHMDRDESTFRSTGDSAYTSFDSAPTYLTNGSPGTIYNHGYGFQWRALTTATNGISRFSGLVTKPRIEAGTVAQLFHIDIQGCVISGSGVVTQQIGIALPLLTGATTNYGIYDDGNPWYVGGDVQFGGIINGIVEAFAGAFHAIGNIDSFHANGGVIIAQPSGGVGVIRSYANGSGDALALQINPTGGQVLVGGTVNATAAQLEVVGQVAATSALISGEINGGNLNSSGGITSFNAGGGLVVAGNVGGGYAVIRSYADGSGTSRGLVINPTGNQVLIGTGANTTAKTLEVGGGVTSSDAFYVDDVKVVGNRDTGWTAMTGTGSKAALAAAAAGTASGAYVQAELQGALNRIAALEARLKSYDDALFAHGAIGA